MVFNLLNSKKMIKVSVIITTCNREECIFKTALDSVLNQTYKNIEVIVVNDSTDEIIKENIEQLIKLKSNNIKYYSNKMQRGANYSRNLGADLSSGEILSFLDDDDYWEKDRVEKIVNYYKNGAEIIYSDYFILSENSKRYSKRSFPNETEQFEQILANNYLGGFSNVSFSRELFYKVGKLDESMKAYQDQEIFVRLLKVGIKLCYIPEPLMHYRISKKSISLNGEKKLQGLMQFMDKYQELYEQYPKSKIIRLENELVYSAKLGWKKNVEYIASLLEGIDSKSRIYRLILKGKVKYFLIKYFNMQ